MSQHVPLLPGVHPSTTIALDAYLAAGRYVAHGRAQPAMEYLCSIQAEASRMIGEAALKHVREVEDG